MKLLPLKGVNGEKVHMGRNAPDGRYCHADQLQHRMVDLILTPTQVLYASGNYCMERVSLSEHYSYWTLREDEG